MRSTIEFTDGIIAPDGRLIVTGVGSDGIITIVALA